MMGARLGTLTKFHISISKPQELHSTELEAGLMRSDAKAETMA